MPRIPTEDINIDKLMDEMDESFLESPISEIPVKPLRRKRKTKNDVIPNARPDKR